VRIAAIADVHCRIDSQPMLRPILDRMRQEADVMVLAGDLTDTGLPAEMEVLLEELERCNLPIVAVLGNHDHESDKAEELEKMLVKSGVRYLNANAFEIDEVGFVGTKGFAGGFGSALVQPFGERALKEFIRASIDEAVALENAVARLTCEKKVAVLHYAPVKETLDGEPLEIFPFLGSSRLANALDRQTVDIIFHGHAHHGSPTGRTAGNIPVYNVSRFVLDQYTDAPFCLVDM
jgi:Icc-related predicted phosphoesterase